MSNDPQKLKSLRKEKPCGIRSNLAQELGAGVMETFTLHPSKRAPNNLQSRETN